ncbi:MAG TPA: hypothetical protein VFH50_04580 [Acidimicrobiales bacterium]|nr:hypothetical protein [Acidimicrobiales bacterium]
MTRFSKFGTDYTDPSAYPGTARLDRTGTGAMSRRGSGGVLRGAAAVFVGIVAVVLAWHLIGLVIGTVFLALKLAVIVGLVAAVVSLVRHFR